MSRCVRLALEPVLRRQNDLQLEIRDRTGEGAVLRALTQRQKDLEDLGVFCFGARHKNWGDGLLDIQAYLTYLPSAGLTQVRWAPQIGQKGVQ